MRDIKKTSHFSHGETRGAAEPYRIPMNASPCFTGGRRSSGGGQPYSPPRRCACGADISGRPTTRGVKAVTTAVAEEVCEGYVSERPIMPECVRKETDECFEEEDEETKIKSLFESVKWEGSEEKYRPFVTKRQLVRKLEENGVHLSTNQLTRHMKSWGYSADDRKIGERGWCDIKFVNDMEFLQDY